LRHYNNKNHPARMVGSMMLIETKDTLTKEDYLVIRGLNPIQNITSKVDINSFYETVVQYVTEIAVARNMHVGIVIDTHSGGSGTNRPELHAHMLDKKKYMKQLNIPTEDTTFNGYRIGNKVFAIS